MLNRRERKWNCFRVRIVVSFRKQVEFRKLDFVRTFSIEKRGKVTSVEWLIKFGEVSIKLSKDLDFRSVLLGFLF